MNENENNPLSKINDKLFITDKMKLQRYRPYVWVPPENLETRFGVELETCIKINDDCIDKDLITAKDKEKIKKHTMSFKEKFDYYYKSIIAKSKSFYILAFEYNYIIIEDNNKVYYYDMTDIEAKGRTADELKTYLREKRINNNNSNSNSNNNNSNSNSNNNNNTSNINEEIDNEISQIKRKHKNYELPMFVDDKSIRCGDTQNRNERKRASIFSSNSFRFECITPILKFKGLPTKENIASVLEPFLLLFGLGKPNCFILNHSMGYHVNVSLYDTVKKMYVAIAEPPFLNRLLKNYIPLERKIYKTVRTRRPIDENYKYITEFAPPLYSNLNNFKNEARKNREMMKRIEIGKLLRLNINQNEISNNEIINTKMVDNEYARIKYKAIKKKSPYLLEFRLFEGDSNIERLINNVLITIIVLHKTADDEKKLMMIPKVKSISKPVINYKVNKISGLFLGGKRKNHKTKKRHTVRNKTLKK
jgi:hypothetical protein